MHICPEYHLAASLLRKEVSLTVTTSGRHPCGAEWVVGPRVIRDHLLYYVVGPGALRLQSGAQELLLPAETFFWLQPGVPHLFALALTAGAPAFEGVPVRSAEVIFFRFFLGIRNQPLRLRAPWVQRALDRNSGRGWRICSRITCHLARRGS